MLPAGLLRVLPLLALLGCPAPATDAAPLEGVDDTGPALLDADGDGYRGADDCDDSDATVSPAGTERCGGGDENCDGTVDEPTAEDARAWYADADGDGFGDAAVVEIACDAPDGTVGDASDCDDTDRAVTPDGTERCGGGDEDCDGTVDEDDAADALPWYADADGDGFGDPAVAGVACEPPPDTVSDATDCDDGDPAVSPAATERCGGGDEDCDGTVDEDDAADALPWYADADGDGFGDPAAAGIACEPPLDTVSDATDCDDGDPTVSPVGTERCGGGDEDCDGAVDDDAADVRPWYADADGDGFGDPAVTEIACEPPLDTVGDATDCDDTDGAIHPGAAEAACDRVDDDCDGVLEGLVVFTDTAGVATDLTASFSAASAGSPADHTIEEAGELALCDGTWYTRLSVAADPVVIVGAGSGSTTLSAGGSGSVVTIDASGSVTLAGFTATGATTSGIYAGPAVTTDLTIDDLAIVDNSGTNGGGLHQELGTLVMDATAVTGNLADYGWGGGLYLLDVEANLSHGDISENGVWMSPAYVFAKGGGVYISPGALTMTDTTLDANWASGARGVGAALYATAPIHLERCDVTNNLVGATEYSGGQGTLYVADGIIVDSWITDNRVSWAGLTAGIEQSGGTLVLDCSGGGGVLRNVGHEWGRAGGARVFGTLVSIGCDWGEGADDNVYVDITFDWAYTGYSYGDAASFTCESATDSCY